MDPAAGQGRSSTRLAGRLGALLTPALSPVALLVVTGWAAAGVVIVTTSLTGWPPKSSLVLQSVGQSVAVLITGALLAAGGVLVIVASRPRLKLSTRWRLETSGAWLLASAWAAYGALSQMSGSVAVALMAIGHVAAALWRLHDLRREECTTRQADQDGRR